uniref:Uncharacterized protein n=2 Tax=Tetranychus urticae TaxID=32264 RepID=T1L2D6_TETUR
MPSAHSDPCVDGIYDSISCDHENKLMVTYNNLIFYGDCSSYPFHVNQNYQVLIDKYVKIIASVTDGHGFQYFFQEQSVILVSKNKRFEKPISEIFSPFSGIIEHAIGLKDRESKLFFGSDFTIQLYTKDHLANERRVYSYDVVKISNGLPFWSETRVLKPLNHSIGKTSTLVHLLSVQKEYITAILGSSSGPIYSKAGLYTCIDLVYQYNLVDCLEENEQIYEKMQLGYLFKCQSKHKYPFDLLTVMLWFSLGLTILSLLGLMKCLIFKLFKRYRITNRRVRFSDEVRGDPKEIGFKYNVSYGPEQIHIEKPEPTSMGQYAAEDVNDDYKDVNLSIDLKEENFASKNFTEN